MRPAPTSRAWPLAGAIAAALFTLANVALVIDVRRKVDERRLTMSRLVDLNQIEVGLDELPRVSAPKDDDRKQLARLSDAVQEIERSQVPPPAAGGSATRSGDYQADLLALEKLVNVLIRKDQRFVDSISNALAQRWNLSHAFLFVASAMAGVSAWLLRRNQLHVLDLRRTQEKLRETQSRLAAVVTNAPIAVWSVDHEGVLTLFEGAALESFGALPGERVGESIFEVHRADPTVLDAHHRALLGEAVDYDFEHNGARLHCLLLPLRDAGGRISGALGIGTDVTEYERAKSEMRRTELQRIENQKAEAVGRVAGGVAHEFSNLLTVVTGFASLLRANSELSTQDREDVQQILKASSRAANLTQQLLAFSRRQRSEPRVVDVNSLITESRRMLEPLLARVEIEIRPSVEALAVRVDPGQFQQVLLNLALNAKDAMPAGGRFAISVRLVKRSDLEPAAVLEPDDYVCISVADTGEGMDEETLGKAFEPFFTTKGPQRGTGLGLPTVQGILRQAGGDVTVTSALGNGTTFRLYVPHVVDAAVELDSDTKEFALSPGRETILLAEDEEMVRSFAARVLRQAGYQVIEAGDGGSALEIARNHGGGIAMLVTDVVMPVLDGPQLAKRFGELRPEVPVVFLSGYSHDEGALEYLQKPFTPQELCRIVRARLDAHALTRARRGV